MKNEECKLDNNAACSRYVTHFSFFIFHFAFGVAFFSITFAKLRQAGAVAGNSVTSFTFAVSSSNWKCGHSSTSVKKWPGLPG